jgi:hypothetical protein
MPRLTSRRPGAGVPLLVSLAVHGLILLLAALATGRVQEVTGQTEAGSEGGLCIQITDPPPRPRPPAAGADDWPIDIGGSTVAAPPVISPTLAPASPGPSAPAPSGPAGGGVTGGAGVAAGPRWLATPPRVRSVVYVLDRSVSMGLSGALDAARAELLASLRRLPPEALFQVIAYNRDSEPLAVNGRVGLLPADPATVEEAARRVAGLEPSGSTDPFRALRRGLLLRPQVLFLVSDGADLTPADAQRLTGLNQGRTAVHVLELGRSRASGPAGALQQLARANGGTYRRVLLR